MKRPVRLGIIGTGSMANVHAEAFRQIPDCQLVAALDVQAERVEKFAQVHMIPAAFTDAWAFFRNRDIDAVSIVAPDAFHAPLTLQALAAGKAVLCEKPLALNYSDASRMVRAARRRGLTNMVNFSYRNWPAIQAVAKLVHQGKLGDLRHVEASYLQAWLVSKAWGDWKTSDLWLWRLSQAHGSMGVLGDVGVHILDFVTFPAGPVRALSCRLKSFPKAPGNRIGAYHLDANDSAVMHLEFANGALGVVHTTRWCGGHANRLYLKIAGTRGTVEIDSDRTTSGYRISSGKDVHSGVWKEVSVAPVPKIYERFIKAVRTGKPGEPDFARGAEIQKLIDRCFESDKAGRTLKV